MHVPFVDVQRINARHHAEFEQVFRRVSISGRYLLGPETEAFENAFAAWCGISHCVSVANGLDALRLVLRAWISMGLLGVDDEVVVPANSFIASALAVTESNLQVRFADVSAQTFNLTLDTLTPVLTSRTRAVMPVHLYGRLADIQAIVAFCRQRGILIVEDAAQAHGAKAGGVAAGGFGNAGAFSFYPSKNLGAFGDAGCVVTNDATLADRVRTLRNYGSRRKYDHELRGANSRMSELQAALLGVKLGFLDADNGRRREIATRYRRSIMNPFVTLPSAPREEESHVWHLFVVTTDHRESLMRHLEASGVETLVHYPRAIHEQPAYRDDAGTATAPTAVRMASRVLSLPISQVMTDSEVEYVIDAINRWSGPAARTSSGEL